MTSKFSASYHRHYFNIFLFAYVYVTGDLIQSPHTELHSQSILKFWDSCQVTQVRPDLQFSSLRFPQYTIAPSMSQAFMFASYPNTRPPSSSMPPSWQSCHLRAARLLTLIMARLFTYKKRENNNQPKRLLRASNKCVDVQCPVSGRVSSKYMSVTVITVIIKCKVLDPQTHLVVCLLST